MLNEVCLLEIPYFYVTNENYETKSLFIFRVSHMNSSGAVGDILVFTFVNLSDNITYTENRKYVSSSSSKNLLEGSQAY